jgi:uncharacterized protein
LIHTFQLLGYNFVLDICSGSVHIVDDLVYAIIERLKDVPRDVALAVLSVNSSSALPENLSSAKNNDSNSDMRHELIDTLSPRYTKEDVEDAMNALLALTYDDKLFCEKDPFEKWRVLNQHRNLPTSKGFECDNKDRNIQTKILECTSCDHENGDVWKERLKSCISTGTSNANKTLKAYDGYVCNSKVEGVVPENLGDCSFKKADGAVKALCLNVAHACNLACSYCFAGQGKYKGAQALMPLETGKRAIDFLVEHSADRHYLEVDFFGGEPLLNWPMVKETVAYARSLENKTGKRFRFTLTTNGILIDDDVIDFTNREMDNIVLSLDGRKSTHDRFRVDRQGSGSYDTVVPKFQELVRRRTQGTHYIRGTFTHANADFLNDILHLLELGFTQISMEPVVSPPDMPYALTPDDIVFIKQQYEELARLMIQRRKEGRPFTFYHYMTDLEHGPCIYKRIAGCGSGTEYLAVTPTGDLYPCHQLVDNPAFLMGNIWDGITNTALQNTYRHLNLLSRKTCRDCWAQLYCSGGCAANAFHTTGDLFGIDEKGCELFRKRMECALAIKAAEALDG